MELAVNVTADSYGAFLYQGQLTNLMLAFSGLVRHTTG